MRCNAMGEKRRMGDRKIPAGVFGLIIGVIAIIGLAVVIWRMCARSARVELSPMYYCGEDCRDASDSFVLMPLSAGEYANLAAEKESFVIFIDQAGCVVANEMRSMMEQYAEAKKMRFYRMQFAEMRKTELKDVVKFYPSVVIIDEGRPVAWLEADSERDEAAYRDYGALMEWLDGRLMPANGAN